MPCWPSSPVRRRDGTTLSSATRTPTVAAVLVEVPVAETTPMTEPQTDSTAQAILRAAEVWHQMAGQYGYGMRELTHEAHQKLEQTITTALALAAAEGRYIEHEAVCDYRPEECLRSKDLTAEVVRLRAELGL